MSDTLGPDGRLAAGDQLDSAGGHVHLMFGGDGNLVLSADRADGQETRWHSNTAGLGGSECVLLGDGALAIRDGQARVIWRSPISSPLVLAGLLPDRPAPRDLVRRRAGRATLKVQDDENVVITVGDRPVWATGTSIGGAVVSDGRNGKLFLLDPNGDRRSITAAQVVQQFGGLGVVSRLKSDQLRQWKLRGKVEFHPPLDISAIQMCHDRPDVPGLVLPPRQVPLAPPLIRSDGTIAPGVSRQPLASETDKLWDIGQTLRIKFVEGGSAALRTRIRQAADTWLPHVNLHFSWVDPGESAHIKIRVADPKKTDDDKRHYSAVGRDALGYWGDAHTMNYGLTDSSSDQRVRATVLHEFGHALGFIHEHQSPAAGIPWDKTKVYEYYWATERWDRGDVDYNVLSRYQATTTNYSAFDPQSIMLYPIDKALTLDGSSTSWNTTLSAVDKKYARDWYPFPPTPGDASGLLRTGDGDEINFNVQYGVVGADQTEFTLHLGGGLTWWKAIEIPVGSSYTMLWVQDSTVDAVTSIAVGDIDRSRPIRFWKAKVFGVHTLLDFKWGVLTAIPGAARVNFSWDND